MKLLDLYEWIAGSMSDFAKPFQENEALFNQAKSFWRHLESFSIILVLLFIIIGIIMAVLYYWLYNNKPGRHYMPTHWLLFWAVTFVMGFVITFLFEYAVAQPRLDGAVMLEVKIALGNGIYSSILYLVISIVWCNALPTNAFRIFKK